MLGADEATVAVDFAAQSILANIDSNLLTALKVASTVTPGHHRDGILVSSSLALTVNSGNAGSHTKDRGSCRNLLADRCLLLHICSLWCHHSIGSCVDGPICHLYVFVFHQI